MDNVWDTLLVDLQGRGLVDLAREEDRTHVLDLNAACIVVPQTPAALRACWQCALGSGDSVVYPLGALITVRWHVCPNRLQALVIPKTILWSRPYNVEPTLRAATTWIALRAFMEEDEKEAEHSCTRSSGRSLH